MKDDSEELFEQLVSFCSQWMPAPMSLQFRLDREISSLTLSSVMIQKTPLHVLKAKPIANLDLQLHNRLEFASIYAISLYDFFNAAELSLQLADADYLHERRRLASPAAQQGTGELDLEQVQKVPSSTIPESAHVSACPSTSKGKKSKASAKVNAKAQLPEVVNLPPISQVTSSPTSPVRPKISSYHRSLVVELLVTFSSQEFTSPSETLHMAVNIMDRFLATRLTRGAQQSTGTVGTKGFAENFTSGVRHTPLEPANLLYVAMAALSLAWKYEEKFRADVMDTAVPAVVGWYQILKAKKGTVAYDLHTQNPMACSAKEKNAESRNKRPREPSPPSPGSEFNYQVPVLPTPTFSNPLRNRPIGLAAESLAPARKHVLAEIISMELEILETLHWQVQVPTTQTFLKRYMLAGQLSMRQCLIATCLCDRTLLSYGLLHYFPSLIAASIVSMVRLLFRLDGWSGMLQHYTGYQQSALDECILSIQGALVAEEIALFSATGEQHAAPASSCSGGDEGSVSCSDFFLAEPTGLGKRKEMPQPSTIEASAGPRLGLGQGPRQKYIPGSSIRAKYKDDIYRSLINLPVRWTRSSRGGGSQNSLSVSSSAPSSASSVTPLSSVSSRLSAGL